jgi:hypothetical protein
VDRSSRSNLLLYALSRCSEREAEDLEAHVLECDACFGDLQVLDRAGVLLREFLGPDASSHTRQLEVLGRAAGAAAPSSADRTDAAGR